MARQRRKISSSPDLADQLIRAMYASMVAELQAEIARREAALLPIRRQLAALLAERDRWQRTGAFNRLYGPRALLMARIADFHDRSGRSGAHSKAMLDFLKTHHPPVADQPDDGATPDH